MALPKDIYTQQRLKLLHPKVVKDFTDFIVDAETALGIQLRISQGYRTFGEQDVIYAQGRTKKGAIVTNAKGGQSYHNYGLAVDLVRMVDGRVDWNYDMRKLLPYAIKHGLSWGGSPAFVKAGIPDFPHFEKTFGLNWRELLKRYQARNVFTSNGTTYVNI